MIAPWEQSPLERLGSWLAVNMGHGGPSDLTHDDATEMMDWLGGSSIFETLKLPKSSEIKP